VLPAPPPEGFAEWAETLCRVHPSARKNRVLDGQVLLATDVLDAAQAAFRRCPDAAQQAELLRAYLDDRMQEDRYRKPFYRPLGQRKFFEDLEDVITHAERWAREAGWKPGKRRRKAQQEAEPALSPEAADSTREAVMAEMKKLKEEAYGR